VTALVEASGAVFSLLHHDRSGEKVITTTVTDAPPITDVMVDALRVQVLPHTTDEHTLPTTWWYCDGAAWSAVVDLHRKGWHTDALSLASLLRWCDLRHSGRDDGLWEITGGEPR